MNAWEPIGCGWPCEPGAKRAPCNGGGGGSSSSTASTTQNTDKRQVVDTGSIGVSSDSSTVTVNASYLDDGAVGKAIDLATMGADRAIDLARVGTESAGANIAEVLGFAKDVLKVAGENLKGTQNAFGVATEKVSSAYQTVGEMSSGQRFMVAGGLVLAGIVAVKALGK